MAVDFFLTSDQHFDMWKAFSMVNPDGTTSRLHHIRRVSEEGLEKANTDLVVIAGDTLHKARSISPLLAQFVRDYFDSMKRKRVLVIPGNHCLRQGGFNSIHSMLQPIIPDHTEYIASPVSLNMDSDVTFHMLPFYPSLQTMKDAINEFKLKHDRINILISHFTPGGARINDDYSTGKTLGYINPIDLKRFDYSFLGDCHTGNQEIGGHIFIPGDPLQHNFGEEGQDKFTYKVTITNAAIKKEKYPSNAPQFKTLYIDQESDIQQITQIDKEKFYLRVISRIPITSKIDTSSFRYIETPPEMEFKKDLDHKSLVREYVKGKNLELVGLLGRYM